MRGGRVSLSSEERSKTADNSVQGSEANEQGLRQGGGKKTNKFGTETRIGKEISPVGIGLDVRGLICKEGGSSRLSEENGAPPKGQIVFYNQEELI